MTGRPPRVFISYSHDTARHQERVLDLADRLRADGIDAEIDQYNDAPAEGWPLWCERQIAAADVVLMVCTETYHRRVKGEEEPGKGLGVVWEAAIIRQLLYDAGVVSTKFVPVLFADGLPEHIPTPVKGWTQYVVDTEDGYEALYRRLTGQPRLTRPSLGRIRALPTRMRRWTEGTMQATTASALRLPEDHGATIAGGERSIAIGETMIGGAGVTGDRNVTKGIWPFLRNQQNRQILTWLGGGLIVVASGLWAVFVYLDKSNVYRSAPPPPSDCSIMAESSVAACGSIEAGDITIKGGN